MASTHSVIYKLARIVSLYSNIAYLICGIMVTEGFRDPVKECGQSLEWAQHLSGALPLSISGSQHPLLS